MDIFNSRAPSASNEGSDPSAGIEGATFICVVFIRTTVERAWDLVSSPDYLKSFFTPEAATHISQRMARPATNEDSGEPDTLVLQCLRPRLVKLALINDGRWGPPLGIQHVTWQFELVERGRIKLKLLHERLSEVHHEQVKQTWPVILSNMKTRLERDMGFTGFEDYF